MTATARTLTEAEPVARVVVEFLEADGRTVRFRRVIGPWRESAAKAQATATRNSATRNGGKVRTRLERVAGWTLVEEVTA